MAVGLLPGRISSCTSNCVLGSDVINTAGCSCRVASMSMPSSSARAFMSLRSFEARTSSFSSFYDLLYVYPVHRFSSSLAGVCLRRKSLSGPPLGQPCLRIGNDQRRSLLRASATKDTGRKRDVVSQSNRNGTHISHPPQRFPVPRNGKAEEELRSETEVQEEQEHIATGENGLSRKDDHSELPSPVLSSSNDSASKEGNVEEQKQEEGGFSGGAALGTIAAGLGLVAVLGGFGALGFFYKEQINAILIQFSDFIEGYGPAGYGLFVLVYASLEVLAIPAIPLTMSAGLLFGTGVGTIIVSIAGTIAATGAFLIARYLARDRILAMAKNNKKFLAIDKAIGEDGFRVVTLLRLSPLLPFSLGNYLYGLTSVKLGPYVLGSWLGMLPGTWAYVSAGAIGRAFIQSEAEQIWTGAPEQLWTLGLGLAATIFAATYVTRLAKEALKDID
ncbi:hypothetical protein AXG93_3459s1150 [Marchantia polymorpha subsp. ruderalis]|uniref:VTT domain-containing protein n=1 Tax=Marchantia polymorpha subsp. ruderalis TaxID=1480154 RepID=A0A176W5S7_MARPO|nr:hypothetical protein AXG93_3459s1150 [Marchantia polymorpha subsp. ruderalis]